MVTDGTSGSPIPVPPWLHLVLWPALVIWVATLVWRRRRGTWPRSPRLGLVLAPLCFLADGAAFAASQAWPTPDSNSLVFALLWLALLLSLTAYLGLRARDDGDDGGDGGDEPEPEPPWWPEFERQFRDYARRPAPGDRPREPFGAPH